MQGKVNESGFMPRHGRRRCKKRGGDKIWATECTAAAGSVRPGMVNLPRALLLHLPLFSRSFRFKNGEFERKFKMTSIMPYFQNSYKKLLIDYLHTECLRLGKIREFPELLQQVGNRLSPY